MARPKRPRCRWLSCGKQFNVNRTGRASKYCRIHRVYRHWRRSHNATRKCRGCDRRFVSWHKQDWLCWVCDVPLGTDHTAGACYSCGCKTRLYRGGLWCLRCLKDPNATLDLPLTEAYILSAEEEAALKAEQERLAAEQERLEAERERKREEQRRLRNSPEAKAREARYEAQMDVAREQAKARDAAHDRALNQEATERLGGSDTESPGPQEPATLACVPCRVEWWAEQGNTCPECGGVPSTDTGVTAAHPQLDSSADQLKQKETNHS